MNLAQKTFTIVFLTVMGLTVVLYTTTRFLMLRSFLRLEDTQTRNAVKRVHNALDDDISGLSATTNDYAAWDRTYDFMQHRGENYIQKEFQYDTLQGLGVNSIMILDKAGKIVFFRRYDFVLHQETEVPRRDQEALATTPWIQQAGKEPASGLMLLAEGPALIAARPILTTQRQGPWLGVLLMTQDLDEARIRRLSAETRSAVSIVPLSAPFRSSQSNLEVVIEPVNDQLVAGSEVLTDVQGTPILEMRLETPRLVFQQGVQSLHYFLGALCLASLGFGAASLLLLRYAILAHVAYLCTEVSRIAELKKRSARVTVHSQDEVGQLGSAINQMLQALETSDLQFRNIAENIHQVFWVEDLHAEKVEYLSSAYESVWGRPRADVYADPLAWLEGVHPEDRDGVLEMRRQQKRGKIGSKEYRIVQPNGDISWVYNRYFPVKDEEGRLRQIAALTENITEFKKAEAVLLGSQDELERLVAERTAELAAANAALAAKEEHFRQLFATIPLPVWLCSEATLRFLEVNEAASEQYGFTREEFLQMTLEEIRPPEEIERLCEDLAKLGRTRSLSRGHKHRAKDGRILDVDVSALRVDFAGVPSILIATHDVTERNRMEVELRHGQKLQAVGELAAGIAHEINTPIQFVGNNVQFLEGAFTALVSLLEEYEKICTPLAGCTSGQMAHIEKISEAADLPFIRQEIPLALKQTTDGVERVCTIVQALKKFSHVDWGPEKATANVNEALESTLIVAGSELKYVADIETAFGDLPSIRCFLGDLNQVFLNLLVNAAHAVGDAVKGSKQRGTIRVETSTEGEWAVIAISDTGNGIPEGIRDRIFDPFFTTKPVGKGTGQGLALARVIVVEKHGGTLTFNTEMGKGTTFYIRIPLDPPISGAEINV